MRVARRYVLSGRVQGVGFRYFTERLAARESIHGWVQNTRDGHVEISAEGDAEAVDRFEQGIRRGPAGARVDHVEVDMAVPVGRDAGFVIR